MPTLQTSLVAQMVKCLFTMQETWVQSLGWEDPLEKEMAIHSSTIAQKIPWTEEPGRLQSMGSQRVGHDFTFTFRVSSLVIQGLGASAPTPKAHGLISEYLSHRMVISLKTRVSSQSSYIFITCCLTQMLPAVP